MVLDIVLRWIGNFAWLLSGRCMKSIRLIKAARCCYRLLHIATCHVQILLKLHWKITNPLHFNQPDDSICLCNIYTFNEFNHRPNETLYYLRQSAKWRCLPSSSDFQIRPATHAKIPIPHPSSANDSNKSARLAYYIFHSLSEPIYGRNNY